VEHDYVDFSNSKGINIISATTNAFKRRTFICLLLHHHQHYIAKVYFNMVFINIFVNTTAAPLHRPHDGHTSPTASDSTTARRHDTDDGIDRYQWLRLHIQTSITIYDDR
jgi:hypothetical protein